jgi:hypothetical protein
MGVQSVTKADLQGIIAAFTTTINALTAQVATLTTRVNNNAANNNNNNNNKNNQNRGGGPIRVPRGRNNRIIEHSSFSEIEETDKSPF